MDRSWRLIKPQFEAGKDAVGKGGVVRDSRTHERVLREIWDLADQLALTVAGLTVSPAPGPAGNIEFLIWLRRDAGPSVDVDSAISSALELAKSLGKKQ